MAAVLPHPFIPRAEREDVPYEGGGLDVALPELSPAPPLMLGGARITELANGEYEVDFDGDDSPEEPPEAAQDHYANLAEHIAESDLNRIAQDIDEMVRADLKSRAPWFERLAKGLELLGVIDDSTPAPFKGASTVVHPLIAEAVVQYQARALSELYPATGPAKSTVLGDRTREKVEQAERVEDYLNYQLTFDDRPYFAESDRKLWLQATDGSAFRKVSRNFLSGKNEARIIKAEHFIVPYSATTLEDAPRYTHLMFHTQNEMRRLQAVGFYRSVQLATPKASSEAEENTGLREARDQQQGRTDPDDRDEDREHAVYETVCELDLKGFEDKDEKGHPTGIALPYVVSVERDSLRVLAIRRGWRAPDPLKKRRIQVVHYPFIRGDGFYGYGLIHLAGGLGRAATGTLRLILDNGAFAALQGGLKSKEGGNVPKEVTLEPGVYKDTDVPYDDLQKAFFTPPFKQVPDALFRVLGLLTELGQRYVNTTDATVGDAKNTGPVGTTVALIEQGQKVATGIHKRTHEGLGQELRLLAELNGEYLPEDGAYPYEIPGASKEVFKRDFGPEIDVEPVSDPNIFSATQRIAMAQAVLELANASPDLYDRREANRMMLEALKVPDVERVLPPEEKLRRCDPVSENAKAMIGHPIKVFPDQHHDAHIAVHMGQLQMLAAQGATSLEIFQQVIIPHLAEHEAQSMRVKMMNTLQMPLPPLEYGEEEEPQELPPEIETMIAMKSAQVMQALVQQLNAAQAQAQAAPGQAQAEQDGQDFEAEQQRKDQALEREEARKDAALKNQIEREDARAGIDPFAVKSATEFLAQHGLQKAVNPRAVALLSKELGKPFADVVRLIMAMRQGGQNVGPAPFAMPTVGGQRQ